jgi:VanZ family protein
MTTRLARAMAWLYAAALVFLTVSSPSFRFETGMPHNLEHVATFGLLGFLYWIGYRSRCLLVLLGGVGLTGILEALQLWAPDRHARWIDFALNAAGLCVGVGVALVVSRSVNHLLARRSRAASGIDLTNESLCGFPMARRHASLQDAQRDRGECGGC